MIRSVQTNFTSGVLDEGLRGRLDLQAYRNGLAVADNLRLLPQGGATRRPGSFVLAIHEHPSQVEAWMFDDDESYVVFFYSGTAAIWDRLARSLVATLAGPWTGLQCEAEELCVLQQLDKMIVAHESFATQVITRTGLSSFAIAELAWDIDPATGMPQNPWHKYAPNDVTMAASAATGTITLTSSADFWLPEHEGWFFRIGKQPVHVTDVTSPTTANGLVVGPDLVELGPTLDWDEQAFTPWHGWPRIVGLHDQRLWIGGGRDCPNVLWASMAGIPFNFALGTGDAGDGIKYPIYAPQVVEIRGLVSAAHLQVFTAQGEFFVPQPQQGGLTPASFSVLQASGWGSTRLRPKIFDQASIFVSKQARALREFVYSETTVSYAADSLTFLSKKLVPEPIDLDVQAEGEGTDQNVRAYLVNADGSMGVLSRVRAQQVAAWGRWTTQGFYRKACCCDHEMWLLVQRTGSDGGQHQYIEVQSAYAMLDHAAGSALEEPAIVHGPFPLYANRLVHVLHGDLWLGEIAVDGAGMLALPVALDEIQIGLNFEPAIEPLVQEVQLPDGLSMGLPRRYVSVTAQLEETLSCRIKHRNLPVTASEDDPVAQPQRFTGQFTAWLSGWSSQPRPRISAPHPLPFTLNALSFEVEV